MSKKSLDEMLYSVRNEVATIIRQHKGLDGLTLGEAMDKMIGKARNMPRDRKTMSKLSDMLCRVPTINSRVMVMGSEEERFFIGAARKMEARTGWSEKGLIADKPEPIKAVEPMKVCKTCGISKQSSCFSRNRNSLDGLHTYCKECDSARRQRLHAKQKAESNQMKLNLNSDKEHSMTTSTTAATLRQQAEALLKQAEEAERATAHTEILEEIRACQLEVARHTAIMSRLSGEMIDAMDGMEKASEALRKACAKR